MCDCFLDFLSAAAILPFDWLVYFLNISKKKNNFHENTTKTILVSVTKAHVSFSCPGWKRRIIITKYLVFLTEIQIFHVDVSNKYMHIRIITVLFFFSNESMKECFIVS